MHQPQGTHLAPMCAESGRGCPGTGQLVRKVWTLILVSVLGLGMTSWAGEIVRLTNGEWPPYYSANAEGYGAGSRIVTEAFALEGVEVVYGFFPWKRALHLAREGIWDGVVGFDANADRETEFFVSDPVWHSAWVFFHLKTRTLTWNSWPDLGEVAVGGTLEYMYTSDFLAAEAAQVIHVSRAPTDYLGFRMLLNGNIDVFPQLAEVGLYQLRTMFSSAECERITINAHSFGVHFDHLMLTRNNPRSAELLRRFNRGLARLRESGRLDELLLESGAAPAAP